MNKMKAWLKVVGLGLAKWPMKLVAPVAYFAVKDKVNHPVFGVRDATDLSWYNIGVRNGCHNMFTRPCPPWRSRANTLDHTLEREPGFMWRYRESEDGQYVSFRVTWGEPRTFKGKREFYVGWTMNEKPYMRLTFFQLRTGLMDYKWMVGSKVIYLWPFVAVAAFLAALLLLT